MSLFTPSAVSSFTAGVVLNSILWSLIYKVKSISKMIYLDRFVNEDAILNWINMNKVIAFAIAKFINLSMHGMNALGVSMALGGSLIDAIVCWIAVPAMARNRQGRVRVS